ncbi:hypothetical protein ACV3P7_01570 [Clostridium perfringens]|uniref:hypothetical protein n=1 Tax=Clostridium perfringens TaxID=1502 RepID=UPI002A68CD54|nr:hypothetical protein [Clostridium perfringens]
MIIIKEITNEVKELSKLAKECNEILNKKTDFFKDIAVLFEGSIEFFYDTSKISNIISEFLSTLRETIQNIDFTNYDCFIKLEEIGWMPCLDLTKDEKKDIVNILSEVNEKNISKVNSIIFKHYSHERIDSIYNEWLKNTYLKKERFELLKQAIECYKNNYFAGCVSLITCQYGGIIKETEEYFNSIPELKAEINKIKKEQKQEEKYIKSEKHIADRIYGVSDFHVTTMLFNDYIKKYVYCDSKSAKYNIPNRNGICHGSLINYNTQEHALKSILIVDSLIRLYMFIDIEEN